MKTNKSVENVEVTPSKKKLTQARLPFKLISEDASTPVPPQTRKRKLSADGMEPAPKGKICKENDIIEDLVVISDDESKDGQKPDKRAKPMNPFVKLVDTAWKKKLQKTKKSPKSRKTRKSASKLDHTTESITENDQSVVGQDVEIMDVDTDNQEINNKDYSKVNTAKSETNDTKENKSSQLNDVVILEDSNPSDIPNTNKIDQEKSETVNTDVNINENAPVTPKTSKKSKSDSVEGNKKEKLNDNESSESACKTPVRKAKSDAKDKINTPTASAKLNESICSSPSTPKRNSRSSSVTNSLNDSVSESAGTPANLTPKQLQKKLESAKKKEEREKEKQEREKKRQEEKEERARQRQEKEDAKKREREEKEEQKRKEKEEKERQKELEKRLREEKEEQKKKEREEKEEQRRKEKDEKEEQKRKEREAKEDEKRKEREAKEDEKRKKQEALELEKHEQELKKKKAAEAFVNFFVPKQKEKEQPKAGPVSQNSILSSFTIKGDMRLAPLVRVELSKEQKKDMDNLMTDQKLVENDLYLKNLKKEGTKIGCNGKTWPLADKDDDDDVMIVEDELPPIEGADEVLACEPAIREKLRPKLFSFHENKRPPYWGTWRKKSAFVKPRRPFGQEKQLDYDVDSDEDWEEEQEGESLDGSAAGSDDEPEDDYEVDNEVFVPHGYLSDEEATMDEEDGDVLSLSPETQKARLKNLEDEFESEMKKPTEKLKPRLYGLLWETKDGGKPEKCVDALWNYFGKLSMIIDDATIASLLQPPSEPQEPEKKKMKKKKTPTEGHQQSPKSEKKKKVKAETKETKKSKPEPQQAEGKKNQPGINSFLTKLKSS